MALLHSLARSHTLVDGNERLALAATIAVLGVNGRRLSLTDDEAYDLVLEVAAGQLKEIAELADRIRDWGPAGLKPGPAHRSPKTPMPAGGNCCGT